MLDLHNLTNKQMDKYNLYNEEELIYSMFDEDEFFIKIGTDWWVVGIDEENDIVYAENDQDYVGGLPNASIEELEENGYAILGIQYEFIPGMISTRDKENPIDDVKEFIEAGKIYKLKLLQ